MYPEIYETFDERFAPLAHGDVKLETLHSDCRWAEGPAYFPAGRYLVWSDIPNDRMLRYDETTGSVGVFRYPAGYTNGHTVDREGRLVSAEQGNRRITRTEHDGSVTVLTERFEGKRFNSPNDLVVASDGAVWFTDPAYGIDTDYEGFTAESEIGRCNVYRIDPSGTCDIVADDFNRPNGLAFSTDESQLYISDSAEHHIRVFDVSGTTLSGGTVFAEGAGFDGFRLDNRGRIWAGVHEGVNCYESDGTLIGRIKVPETVANLCFGGPKRNYLYMCATTSLYGLLISATGIR